MSRRREAKYPTRRVMVTEVDLTTYQHTRYVWFDIPFVCDPGGYVALISYDAFFHGARERNWSPKFLYVGHVNDEIDVELKFNHFIRVPNIVVKTIWDFYKLIGFDYKKNRYADGRRIKRKKICHTS